MSDTASRMLIEIKVDGSDVAIKRLDKVGKASSGTGSAADKASKSHGRFASSLDKLGGIAGKVLKPLGYVAGLAGIAGVGDATYQVIKAGIQWQSQITSITQSLKAQGIYSKGVVSSITDAVEKSATAGGFGQQQQLSAIGQFITETHSKVTAINDDIAATNLARGAHLSFQKATMMVARAQSGTTGRLQQYLGIIQPVTTAVDAMTSAQKDANPAAYQAALLADKQATAQKALGLINEKYASQTKAYSNTAQGAMSNLSNVVEHIEQVLGAKLIPFLTKAAVWGSHLILAFVADFPKIEKVAKSVFASIKPYIVAFWAVLEHVGKAIIGIVKWLFKTKGVLDILVGILAAIGIAFAGFEIYEALTAAWGIATGLWAIAAAGASIATSGWAIATGLLAIAIDSASLPLLAIIAGVAALIAVIVLVVTHFTWFKKTVFSIFNSVYDFLKGIFNGILNIITTVFHAVINFLKKYWPFILPILFGPFGAIALALIKWHKQIFGAVKTVFNDIKNFIAGIVKWVIKELGKIVGFAEKLPGKLVGLVKKIPVVGGLISIAHSIFGNKGGLVPAFASGGVIPGYGSSDTFPAMLTPGEFIIRKQAVQSLGVGTLNAMNQAPGGSLGSSGSQEYVPIQIINKIDSRVLSESVAKYTLIKARRL